MNHFLKKEEVEGKHEWEEKEVSGTGNCNQKLNGHKVCSVGYGSRDENLQEAKGQ